MPKNNYELLAEKEAELEGLEMEQLQVSRAKREIAANPRAYINKLEQEERIAWKEAKGVAMQRAKRMDERQLQLKSQIVAAQEQINKLREQIEQPYSNALMSLKEQLAELHELVLTIDIQDPGPLPAALRNKLSNSVKRIWQERMTLAFKAMEKLTLPDGTLDRLKAMLSYDTLRALDLNGLKSETAKCINAAERELKDLSSQVEPSLEIQAQIQGLTFLVKALKKGAKDADAYAKSVAKLDKTTDSTELVVATGVPTSAKAKNNKAALVKNMTAAKGTAFEGAGALLGAINGVVQGAVAGVVVAPVAGFAIATEVTDNRGLIDSAVLGSIAFVVGGASTILLGAGGGAYHGAKDGYHLGKKAANPKYRNIADVLYSIVNLESRLEQLDKTSVWETPKTNTRYEKLVRKGEVKSTYREETAKLRTSKKRPT